ncbi:MAG: hypothetical protein CVU05_02290 [Bacteroidetes bacterium HGW-Bacteroidetes-21]|jgi:hypothetical protein|nr:MAG: hypothetical protein CVU05_02290 [Bacteroidetes bacterium HGW-Bacteroidetes-21]
MTSDYQILKQRLQEFIRKYYRNELLKGLLFLLSILVASFLVVSVFEYYARFPVAVRTVLFYLVIALWTYITAQYIFIPLLRLYNYLGTINQKQAASIISKHFSDIKDQMVNVIELAEMKHFKSVSPELVLASINHKISNISPFRFESAIDSKTTKRVLYRLGAIGLVFISVYLISPESIQQGSQRIINYSSPFLPEAPFTFILENDSLNVEKGKDYEVKLTVEGKYLPSEVFFSYGDARFAMEKMSAGEFRYIIRNVNNSLDFRFKADEFSSKDYELKVLPAPAIINFTIEADVPEYTGEKDFTLQQNGDVTVPAGTKLTWTFNTDQVEEMSIVLNDSLNLQPEKSGVSFILKRRMLSSTRYSINTKNKFFQKKNLVSYFVNVIPDLYPSIKVESLADSVRPGVFYFRGRLSDDYGFTKLLFTFSYGKDSTESVVVPVSKGTTGQDFYFMYDFSPFLTAGKTLEYFFEVWDNDAVHGPKSAKSNNEVFTVPTSKEIAEFMKDAEKSVKENLDNTSKKSEKLKDDLKKFREEMLNREMTDFEKTQKLKSIMEQYKQLEKSVNTVSNEFQKRNEYLNTFSEQQQEILDKQQQVEDLMENLIDDEMKEMMEELSKLMEDFDKNKLNELAEKIDYNLEDMNKQLDRNLELLKKLQLEEKVSRLAEDLNNLAEKQQELSEETADKKDVSQENKDKQDKIGEEFKKITEEYKKAQEENKNLERPENMPDMQEQSDQVEQEMQQAGDNMQKNNSSKASKNQKNAANKMKKMSADMKQMMQQSSCSAQKEDMDNLRNILDNLVKFSLSQEDLMNQYKVIQSRDPKYVEKIAEQKRINENFEVIKDSLFQLSKRTPMISSVINKEVLSIVRQSDEVIENLDERQTSQARTKQQFIMTSANNLALLLDEVLDQMIKNSQKNQSNSQCNKPGQGQMSLQQMKSMQQNMKSQMQSMIDQLKGQSPKDGKGNSEKLGKMLAEQEKFRQMMNEMMRNGKLSPQAMQQLKEINQLLDEVEKDIIQKNVTRQTVMRQEQILTRLLQAEKSEYERETDNKRESKSGLDRDYSNPEEIFKYKGLHLPLNETLDENKIKLVRFYNNKYREYLNNLNE